VISPAGGGSEDAVVGVDRSSRSRDENHESLEEGGGLEAEGLSAVGEGPDPLKVDPPGRPSSASRNRGLPKTEEELPFRSEGELLGGEGRTEDVAGKSLAAEAFARGDAHGGVEREAVGASAERSGNRGAARESGIAEARDGLASFGTECLTAEDRARVASSEERLLFESRV
jgi:hypothetical protein